jgi:hypothetical protein
MFIRIQDSRLGGHCPKRAIFPLKGYPRNKCCTALWATATSITNSVYSIINDSPHPFQSDISLPNWCMPNPDPVFHYSETPSQVCLKIWSYLPLKLGGGGGGDSFDYRSTRFFPDSPRPASPSNLTPEILHLTFGRDEDGDIFKPNVNTNASVASSAAFSLVQEETHSGETASAKVPDALQHSDRFRDNEARVPLSNGHQKRFSVSYSMRIHTFRTRINKKKP